MTEPPKLLYVVTEDWFFASHFLSVAAAAREAGFAVGVVVRSRDPALVGRIEAAGVRVIASRHERGQFGPLAMLGHVVWFAKLFRAERPDIVHLISVRLIVLAGLGAVLAGVRRRVQAVTGLGLIGASAGTRAKVALRLLGRLLRGPLGGRRVRYVFENREDPVALGMGPDDPALTIVGGAGIDPARETELPMPPMPPLRVAVVARMVRSKGVDVAVEAVRRARSAGVDVALSIYGAPDPENPRSLSAATLEAWSREPGIVWRGHAEDVRAVWRDHHVVCVPSRGGEGLPRSLLEGAAAGRAVVTTRTPGCATFARDGIEGFVTPPEDVDAMAKGFVSMAADPDLVARFGHAARARVLDGFTTEAVAKSFVAVYRALVSG
ncbi:MAG TPA: glycosyltransferase [Lichenihabitans sp.]|jgi:glycosyltransferase involved in cell wall biosynthesis|nr:glycosyltransferase [Lichenihabitans sp.]